MAVFKLLKTDEELYAMIKEECYKYLRSMSYEEIEEIASGLFDDLVKDAIMGVLFDFDIERKTGLQKIIDGELEDGDYQIIDGNDVDIFGQSFQKKNYECVCPCCNRTISACRFAPHLEKCMGMGRNSSRIASQRIASNVKKDLYATGEMEDDDDDADWSSVMEKKAKKKKDKVLPKKSLPKITKP